MADADERRDVRSYAVECCDALCISDAVAYGDVGCFALLVPTCRVAAGRQHRPREVARSTKNYQKVSKKQSANLYFALNYQAKIKSTAYAVFAYLLYT